MSNSFWETRKKLSEIDKYAYPTIHGYAYCVGDEDARGERGFGVHVYHITFDDGLIIRTSNLYLNGMVPDELRESIPNNAHFSDIEELENCAIYEFKSSKLKLREVKANGKAE